MTSKASIAKARLELQSTGYSQKDSNDVAKELQKRRVCLRCEACNGMFVVAGDNRTSVTCLCDGSMERAPAIDCAKHWLDQEWYCATCPYTVKLSKLIEVKTTMVWEEKERKLTLLQLPARSVRRSVRQ